MLPRHTVGVRLLITNFSGIWCQTYLKSLFAIGVIQPQAVHPGYWGQASSSMEILDSVDNELEDLPWSHISEAPNSQTPAPPGLLLSTALMAQKVIFSWLIIRYQNNP